jgi:hypothetical protein
MAAPAVEAEVLSVPYDDVTIVVKHGSNQWETEVQHMCCRTLAGWAALNPASLQARPAPLRAAAARCLAAALP